MKREIYLRPTTIAVMSPWHGYKGCWPGTSPYRTSNTPTYTIAEAWADEDNTSYNAPQLTDAVFVNLDIPPTMILINKVTIESKWDYSNAGPNVWWFPADNAYGPTLRLTMQGRAGATIIGTSQEVTGAYIASMFVNTNTEVGVFKLRDITWEMTAHPEGGPWTFQDVYELKVGVDILLSDGPNGKWWDTTNARWPRVRVPWFRVTLDVQDLGGYVDSVRNSASLTLRQFRRARNVVKTDVSMDKAIGDVGSHVYMSHPKGPSVGKDGWGRRRLERRHGLVLRRTISPESFRVKDEIFDMQHYACLLWAAYRITLPWSPELQGMAFLDKGNGFTHVRASQDGWSARPGDSVLMRVLEDYPNISGEGLACQGGGDVTVCDRNYDLMQTGWADQSLSGLTITADTTSSMVQEQGYFSSAKYVFAGGGGTGNRYRSLGTLPYASGDFGHVRIVVKNTSVPTPASQYLEWMFARSGGGLPGVEYWDNTTRTWTTITYNAIPSVGAFAEVLVDAIPLDAGGASSDPTYSVHIGRWTSAIADCTFNAGIVDIQHSTSAVAGARTPLVVLDTPITRVADQHRIDNTTTEELWSYERGVAVVEGRPFWRAEDLPTDSTHPLIHAEHATDSSDAIQFVAKTGSDDLVRFERKVSGQSTFTLDCLIDGIDMTRDHVLRVWARWLGADGWTEYSPYSVEVGYAITLESTGALVSTASSAGVFTYTGDVSTRDWIGVGNDSTDRNFDGWIRMLEVRRNPISGLESVWRI